MKLQDLSAKPKLIEIILDSDDVVKEFGEPISFWTWDRQPMHIFVKLASVDNTNIGSMMSAVRELVLNEQGQQIITEDNMLPTRVLMLCITRIVESLGKF